MKNVSEMTHSGHCANSEIKQTRVTYPVVNQDSLRQFTPTFPAVQGWHFPVSHLFILQFTCFLLLNLRHRASRTVPCSMVWGKKSLLSEYGPLDKSFAHYFRRTCKHFGCYVWSHSQYRTIHIVKKTVERECPNMPNPFTKISRPKYCKVTWVKTF